MSQKDYIEIADLIKTLTHGNARDILAIRLSDLFSKGNPRFDRARFIAACGVNS